MKTYKTRVLEKAQIENSRDRKKVKNHKGLKAFFIVVLMMAILAGGLFVGGYFFLNNKLNLVKRVNINIDEIGISSYAEERLKDYRNIALLGIDTRGDDYSKGNRTDTIMIISINKKTNEVNLFSIYRDTALRVNEGGKERIDKINHAYSYGVYGNTGVDPAQNTLKSLNQSLDLNIKEFVTINFDTLVDVIDELGGVTITVEENEIKNINEYIWETALVAGKEETYIDHAGEQLLNGVQAVTYARIRSTAGGDYKRAERQRIVLDAIIKKAKEVGILELNRISDELLPHLHTNMTNNDILSLLPKFIGLKINESKGWPYSVEGYTTDRWLAIPTTLESNVIKLHREIFKDEEYTPSETVKEISNEIIKKTGLSKDKTEESPVEY